MFNLRNYSKTQLQAGSVRVKLHTTSFTEIRKAQAHKRPLKVDLLERYLHVKLLNFPQNRSYTVWDEHQYGVNKEV